VRGAERFFDRAEVRQATGLLRVAARTAQAMDAPRRPGGASGAVAGNAGTVTGEAGTVTGEADAPARAVGAAAGGAGAAAEAPGAVAEVRHVLSGLGLTREPPAGRGAARERWESLAALAQLAEDFCAAVPGASLADVVAELAHRAAIGHAPQVEGVTVASLHAAKGLEWDVVFLPGLTEGNLPIIHAETDDAVAEERRLLYVGVTRARQQVLLSWPLARAPGGRMTRQPSRFLEGLRPGRRVAMPRRNRAATPQRQAAGAHPGSGR
jgi:DNA helicase-2/ATP-dependent DNA helicase PcrA